jgi:outer membrane protein OmpA-like peptidoglycan-associated protein
MVNEARQSGVSELLRWIMLGVIILGISGCASKTRIVLLPDPDGHVGQVEVSSEAGEQVLNSAYETTEVSSAGKPPSKPVVMDEAVINDTFKDALASQPKLPLHYLLYFISGTNDLTEASLELIPEVIRSIENRRSTDISVVGHTDRVGSASYNRQLSLERAEAIAEMLISRGIDRQIIEITSHGEENPLVETPDDTAEPRNRRVEITVR